MFRKFRKYISKKLIALAKLISPRSRLTRGSTEQEHIANIIGYLADNDARMNEGINVGVSVVANLLNEVRHYSQEDFEEIRAKIVETFCVYGSDLSFEDGNITLN